MCIIDIQQYQVIVYGNVSNFYVLFGVKVYRIEVERAL